MTSAPALVILRGNSASGKSTIARKLLAAEPELGLSVSATTRPMRPGEEDGRDYHFVTLDRFREMAKAEERGGEDWTDEKKAEYEKKVTGKILAAAWRGSKFEIQGVLRDVVDKVLYDKSVKLEKRVERAHALVIIGELFQKVCHSLRKVCCGSH